MYFKRLGRGGDPLRAGGRPALAAFVDRKLFAAAKAYHKVAFRIGRRNAAPRPRRRHIGSIGENAVSLERLIRGGDPFRACRCATLATRVDWQLQRLDQSLDLVARGHV